MAPPPSTAAPATATAAGAAARAALREDLTLVAMSATLDADRLRRRAR